MTEVTWQFTCLCNLVYQTNPRHDIRPRTRQLLQLQSHLQVLHGDLHAGQVQVRHPGAAATGSVAHGEHVGERLSHHRLVSGDGGHGRPVALVGNEAGHPGYLLVRRDLKAAGEGRSGPGHPHEEEQRRSAWSGHGRCRTKEESVASEVKGEGTDIYNRRVLPVREGFFKIKAEMEIEAVK